MDWTGVVEKNQERLKRILAMLVAMAGLSAASTSPLWGSEGRARPAARPGGGISDLDNAPTRRPDDRLPPLKEEVETVQRPTLPRRLHRAILRLLRPLEAAARRLIIVAARDIVVTLPPSRPRKPKPDMKAAHAALRSLGIAVVLSPADIARGAAERRTAEKRAAARAARLPALPLLDPLPRPFCNRRRTVPPHAAPRILSFDGAVPHRLPPPP